MTEALKQFAKDCDRPFNEEFVMVRVDEMQSRPDCLVLNIEDGNAILIANVFTHFWDPTYYMTCEQVMYVKKEARGRGLGKKLIEQYLDWALSLKVNEIELGARCDLSDFDVEKLFMKYGFKKEEMIFRRKV